MLLLRSPILFISFLVTVLTTYVLARDTRAQDGPVRREFSVSIVSGPVSTSSAVQISACVAQCLDETAQQGSCSSVTEKQCFCTNDKLPGVLEKCIIELCPFESALTQALAAAEQLCKSPVSPPLLSVSSSLSVTHGTPATAPLSALPPIIPFFPTLPTTYLSSTSKASSNSPSPGSGVTAMPTASLNISTNPPHQSASSLEGSATSSLASSSSSDSSLAYPQTAPQPITTPSPSTSPEDSRRGIYIPTPVLAGTIPSAILAILAAVVFRRLWLRRRRPLVRQSPDGGLASPRSATANHASLAQALFPHASPPILLDDHRVSERRAHHPSPSLESSSVRAQDGSAVMLQPSRSPTCTQGPSSPKNDGRREHLSSASRSPSYPRSSSHDQPDVDRSSGPAGVHDVPRTSAVVAGENVETDVREERLFHLAVPWSLRQRVLAMMELLLPREESVANLVVSQDSEPLPAYEPRVY